MEWLADQSPLRRIVVKDVVNKMAARCGLRGRKRKCAELRAACCVLKLYVADDAEFGEAIASLQERARECS